MHIWLLLNSNTSTPPILVWICWHSFAVAGGLSGPSLLRNLRPVSWGGGCRFRLGFRMGAPQDGSLGPWIGPAYLLYHASLICSPGPLHFLLGHLILSPWSNKGYITHPPTDMFHYIWGKRSIWLWNNRWWLYNHFLYLCHQVREGVESYSHLE